jgi:uncharacterized protein YkwD
MRIRSLTVLVALGLAAVPVLAAAEPAPRQPAARPANAARQAPARLAHSRDAAAAIRMVNAYRASRWAGPVTVDARLNAAAIAQTEAMVRSGVMSHDAGGSFASRMHATGVRNAVENLGQAYASVGDAVTGWRNSPPHEANLVNREMTRAGFARGVGADGRSYWTLIMAR